MVDSATASREMSSAHEPAATVAGPIRRRVRALLTRWGLRAETVDDALLVVEELVANVIDHARTRFRLVVRLVGDVVHIAVRDHCLAAPHVQPFDPLAVRGRGLQLVTRLSRRWGCEQHPDGKTVWAELAA
jgi:anti-sigma regulatory factor (Ser/Thr protein kinase)